MTAVPRPARRWYGEYLGSEINRVSAYRQVMLYSPDDPRIDPDIRERLATPRVENGLFGIE